MVVHPEDVQVQRGWMWSRFEAIAFGIRCFEEAEPHHSGCFAMLFLGKPKSKGIFRITFLLCQQEDVCMRRIFFLLGRYMQKARNEKEGGMWQGTQGEKWHRVERVHGLFLRRFRLPENVKVEEVKAGMENGVLTVTVPKMQKPSAKTIDITCN
ncbi:hypothetical protein KP509_29G030800 [Ceratopteris richardii]|uniref:SHSP domain-containing protein n=1 Tax=Ceratopteris richardii TaxID=49495 RepID=A0A8T2R826_CERRI|nr:hypothetical protein KP509_29G030800 [Ceratopteris richardii]